MQSSNRAGPNHDWNLAYIWFRAPVHHSAPKRVGRTPLTWRPGATQAAITLGNLDGEIGGLTISDPPTQAEVQALRYKHEDATSFTVRTDSNSGAAMCQVRSTIILTPSADGNIALRCAKETWGGTSGPTLKKNSWVRASVVG